MAVHKRGGVKDRVLRYAYRTYVACGFGVAAASGDEQTMPRRIFFQRARALCSCVDKKQSTWRNWYWKKV